ncbi:MAG TPA: AraC family transcriptional regulator [Aliidongia sp.]|nr:AraC family transcriptional regulator [Aliidongia sp.]
MSAGDPVIEALDAVLSLALERSGTVSHLFIRNVRQAIDTYLADSHDGMPAAPGAKQQSLTLWQERRAKEFLAANAGRCLSIGEVAAVCNLSQSHFIRAFRNATGDTPHRWLRRYRVDRAKRLLEGPLSIAEIALECGFSDQSHLTRVFAAVVGMPPGAWRRTRGLEHLRHR